MYKTIVSFFLLPILLSSSVLFGANTKTFNSLKSSVLQDISNGSDYKKYIGIAAPTILVGGLTSYITYSQPKNQEMSYTFALGLTSLSFLYYTYKAGTGYFSNNFQDSYVAETLSEPYALDLKRQHYEGKKMLLSLSEKYSKSKIFLETQKVFENVVEQAIKLVPGVSALNWELLVVSDTEPAASSLPGGKITITTGMISALGSSDALAAVLGHETGHILSKHSGKKLALLNTVTSLTEPFSHVPVFGLFHAIFQGFAPYMYNLPVSRSHEHQADRIGMYLASNAGYSPEGALKLMDILEKVTGDKSSKFLQEYTSTHPISSNRRAALEKYLDDAYEIYLASDIKHEVLTFSKIYSDGGEEESLFFQTIPVSNVAEREKQI